MQYTNLSFVALGGFFLSYGIFVDKNVWMIALWSMVLTLNFVMCALFLFDGE